MQIAITNTLDMAYEEMSFFRKLFLVVNKVLRQITANVFHSNFVSPIVLSTVWKYNKYKTAVHTLK